jgi:translation initiation factor IF-3
MANNFQKKKSFTNEYRINDEIHGDVVRLIYKPTIGNDGFNKVVSMDEARHIAESKELDLIEINNKTTPVIVRMEDYSKFLYEMKKQAKQKKKVVNVLKEVQLSTNISEHDLLIKVKKAKEFIGDGDKVKVVLTMKGRELGRREESKTCLYKFITNMDDVAVPESMPKDENNKSIVILKKK